MYKLVAAVVLTTFITACSDTAEKNSAREDTDTFTLEDKNINEVTLPDTMRNTDSL